MNPRPLTPRPTPPPPETVPAARLPGEFAADRAPGRPGPLAALATFGLCARRSARRSARPPGDLAPSLRGTRAVPADGGFTLIELLVVVIMAGVLAAIAAPSWVSFATNQRLGSAQDAALRALRDAQARARQQKRDWETCFRDEDGLVEYSVHPYTEGADRCGNASWQLLMEGDDDLVAIDTGNTTFKPGGGGYSMVFRDNGWVGPRDEFPQLGRITFQIRDQEALEARSCTYVSTLLGAMRVDRDEACGQDAEEGED